MIKAKSTLDEHCEIFLLSYFYNLRTQGKAKFARIIVVMIKGLEGLPEQ